MATLQPCKDYWLWQMSAFCTYIACVSHVMGGQVCAVDDIGKKIVIDRRSYYLERARSRLSFRKGTWMYVVCYVTKCLYFNLPYNFCTSHKSIQVHQNNQNFQYNLREAIQEKNQFLFRFCPNGSFGEIGNLSWTQMCLPQSNTLLIQKTKTGVFDKKISWPSGGHLVYITSDLLTQPVLSQHEWEQAVGTFPS